MRGWARRLEAIGVVVPFDYPYMRAGRKSPDRLPTLIAAHREALEEARRRHGAGPSVLVGKSMGSRVGCHLSLEVDVAALVCLGYPLRGANGALRDEVLLALRAPLLFVQGSRDPLGPLQELDEVRRRMRATSALHVVEGGNHSLEVTKRVLAASGETQDRVDARILEAIRSFLREQAGVG
jgi:predicted alpha/beta-hydrolase family hydrolase